MRRTETDRRVHTQGGNVGAGVNGYIVLGKAMGIRHYCITVL